MVDAGCDSVVMEVSSQGLMLHRTAGIPFEIGIFTNLGEDHIGPNEHKDFDDYKRCKGLLFKQCKIGIANVDDEHFEGVFKEATCKVETFGFSEKADLRANDTKLVSRPGYLGIAYEVSGLMNFDVEIDIPGKFSVYNSLTAIAVCRHFNVPVLFAKKSNSTGNVSDEFYSTKVVSFTHGHEYSVVAKKKFISSDDRILIIDDFLANGTAMKALISLCKIAGATVVGCGTAVEKVYQGGGEQIRRLGYRVESLARISSMSDDGRIEFC